RVERPRSLERRPGLRVHVLRGRRGQLGREIVGEDDLGVEGVRELVARVGPPLARGLARARHHRGDEHDETHVQAVAHERSPEPVRVLLVNTYELGHQPVGIAAPAAVLRDCGHHVRALDLSVESWDADAVAWADRVAFSVPMHTAMRIARKAIARTRVTRTDL